MVDEDLAAVESSMENSALKGWPCRRQGEGAIFTLYLSVPCAFKDTTAGAISTLFYILARRPDIQRRAREKVLNVLGDDLNLDLIVEQLSGVSLSYLTACEPTCPAREVLYSRTYSPDCEYLRYPLRRQTMGISRLFQYREVSTARMVEVWMAFLPILEVENLAFPAALRNLLSTRSWSAQCPARNFAMYEQRALAAVFLREHEWALPEHSMDHRDSLKNTFSPFALMLLHDLELTFTRRMSLGVPKDGE
ncbi:uncharacterized protein BT62DRAFT_1079437 [Guyanagaster necrorhizus]|uniref:Uncharacterized protein n=1 Tax=Guyanagaster necrorhizus TaxID=856835 RepID=A0A9P7VJL4_9AGAR|nr:uncharacterized protein BT62DRAFT_1079437 [Guyanagaster necrorhizus MCA 3950]KAG7442333.1 hypothetical protein BT62DRAFT_1079437 [Guyanagaster necrorhizus MCA 3950]